jgi:CRP/FNR family cyclic AMP-dependent transcriptional regulator
MTVLLATDRLIESIKDQGLLRNLDPHHVHRLAGLALEASFEPEQVIFREGDAKVYFYLITSGSVVLEVLTPARHIKIQTLHQGDAMGWSSLLDTSERHFQARALSSVTAVAFDGAELRQACEQHPSFGYALMKRLLETVTERVDASRQQIGKTTTD